MSAAQKMLLQLLEDGSDLELVFDAENSCSNPQTIAGHSQVLRLWSKVIREAIDAENNTSSEGKIRVPMPGTRKQDWLLAMEFLYPVVPAPAISWDNLGTLLAVTDKCCMSALTQQLATFLQQNMGQLVLAPNSKLFIWKWIFMADRYNLIDIAKQIISSTTDMNGLVQSFPMRQSQTYNGHKLSADTLQHMLAVIPTKAIILQPNVPYCCNCKAHRGQAVDTRTRLAQQLHGNQVAHSQQYPGLQAYGAQSSYPHSSSTQGQLAYDVCPVCQAKMVIVYCFDK